jgi:small-conductance mechanosensitive channel
MSSLTAGTLPFDPLIIVLGLFAAGLIASRFFFRKHPVGRAIVRVVFLILLTIALLDVDIVPYQPLQSTGSPLLDLVHAILKIAWWLWAAWFLVSLSRAALIIEDRRREGRLLQDLISGLLYLAAAFAIITYVFDLPIRGLLATSGVIAIILGLALQSTLGDAFSGIVLNFSRPYRPGDWVNIAGETSGRVIEMTWRATHILTAQRDLAIIPNSTIAKSKIVNVSSPSGIHGVTIVVQAAAGASPAATEDLLQRAILNCRQILKTPASSVIVKAMNAAFVEFELNFFVRDLASITPAQNELLDLIYRHLTLGGVDLASPASGSTLSGGGKMSAEPLTEGLLKIVSVFATLTESERHELAGKLKPKRYGQGETVVAPGTLLKSQYLIASGVLSCVRYDEETDEELLRLGPADHFGELGLLAKTASPVRISALTPAVVYELGADDLEQVLQVHPEIADALNRDLAQRQETISPPAPIETDNSTEPHGLRSRVSGWLHRRYDLATSR